MRMYALLVVIILVLGVYILPSVAARFSGPHTMEFNESEGIYAMRCTRCHSYILNELGATDPALDVFTAHLNAAGDGSYIGSGGEINITRNELPLFNGGMVNVCLLCHLTEQGSLSITGSHTKMIIRVCTDEDCHGNSSTTGTTTYTGAGMVGRTLGNDTDAHSGFFRAVEGGTSSYLNEDGGNYSTGFYACLACHTHLEMNMNLSRPQSFNINMTLNSSTDTFDIEGPEINYTNMNVSSAQRPKGPVWK